MHWEYYGCARAQMARLITLCAGSLNDKTANHYVVTSLHWLRVLILPRMEAVLAIVHFHETNSKCYLALTIAVPLLARSAIIADSNGLPERPLF